MNSTLLFECDVAVYVSELLLARLKESGNMLNMALVIIEELSFNATAVFKVLHVMLDLHVPLSRCCVSAEGTEAFIAYAWVDICYVSRRSMNR